MKLLMRLCALAGSIVMGTSMAIFMLIIFLCFRGLYAWLFLGYTLPDF